MISASDTVDEKARLKALFDYDVLDTDAERVFDDLTQLASEICETPIALISLVDPDRQWFKSKVGLDANETSRDIAFCSHAIHHRQVFEVKDTLQDERFFDNPLVTQNPKIRFYAGAQLVTPEGHAIGTLCAISDKPKQLNPRQKNALEILSREVISQLELRKKIKLLGKANERKTDYLSNISHELRTPLNAIISFSQIMLGEIKQHTIPEKFKNYLTHLDDSGRRLLGLVNSVLDLSKIEEGKMELNLVPVASVEFLESIRAMLSVKAEKKKIKLSLRIDDTVPAKLYTDEGKLGQIIINLLSNGLKFTTSGKNVDVQAHYYAGELILTVRDQGVGISEQDQTLLFNKFQQVGKKSEEGTGLGLAITKGLVDLMRGSIKLSSVEGKGTLVKVSLPIRAYADTETKHDSLEKFNDFNPNSHILVVEDNLINQEVAEAIFESLGLTISIANSGEQALQKACSRTYDLIFMDLHLPNMSGFEAASQIHQLQPGLPIVALTADAFIDRTVKQSNTAMRDYLTKPIDKNRLLSVLNKYLN